MPDLISLTSTTLTLIASAFIAHYLFGSLDGTFLSHTGSETSETGKLKKQSAGLSQRAKEKEEIILKKLLSKDEYEIDEFCSGMDQVCFVIMDRVRNVTGRILAFRRLKRKGPQGVLTLSETRLQPPSPLTWKNFNSKTWKVRKDTARLVYARVMIAGSFMSGALQFNTTKKQDVLIIGLGGGVINNYLTTMKNQKLNVTVVEIDPVMKKIAEKWFDFQESPLHRIIIDDGVRFMYEAAKRGEKYNVVLLDVSYNIILPLMGPTQDFLKDDVIASMRAITANDGAAIINTVTSKDARDAANAVHFAYSRHYPSCYFMEHAGRDKMLFCSAKKKNSWLDNRDELYNRYIAVDDALGFQLTLRDQCSSYPLD
ncbi:hypothetical protein RB195_021515 [Necator americanus]|uniref:Spermine/spermidine synthase n=1 Tax=Necator americanus TaxID=51031 RepID=A0ABR1EE12_NECAM